mmetsp:Transcript_84743/g.197065  ORF Transcript_84743/g.197065 Transcript_84743/m.197065 type:complete len:202 (-) Transcript_84743:1489-2094(-)
MLVPPHPLQEPVPGKEVMLGELLVAALVPLSPALYVHCLAKVLSVDGKHRLKRLNHSVAVELARALDVKELEPKARLSCDIWKGHDLVGRSTADRTMVPICSLSLLLDVLLAGTVEAEEVRANNVGHAFTATFRSEGHKGRWCGRPEDLHADGTLRRPVLQQHHRVLPMVDVVSQLVKERRKHRPKSSSALVSLLQREEQA